jgi:molybdate transport system ATP-binding protein
VQRGAPGDIAARPRTPYVADLVGVNLLRGIGSAGRVTLAGGVTLTVPDPPAGDVFAVIHPRAVALHRAAPTGTPRNVWAGRVTAVDDEGERVRVSVEGDVRLVAEVTPAAVTDLRIAPGESVWAAVKATEIDVYEA